jgi:hypothetical protein
MRCDYWRTVVHSSPQEHGSVDPTSVTQGDKRALPQLFQVMINLVDAL